MIIQITLNDPDGVYDSLKTAADESVAGLVGINGREKEELANMRVDQMRESCKPWISSKYYITIEIDTEAGMATVCKV